MYKSNILVLMINYDKRASKRIAAYNKGQQYRKNQKQYQHQKCNRNFHKCSTFLHKNLSLFNLNNVNF